jgi:PPK2 family polyphosphate:nucleotide phosphotransferase
MLLKPVSSRRALSLTDDDARAPRGLPKKDVLREKLAEEGEALGELQKVLYAEGRHALLVILQGRDASGKDGTIRTVFDACNPQGCEVTSFKAPTSTELAHDFLWRIHNAVPARGMIGIFNRSHYEDVLAVRVKKLAPKAVWQKRYRQINEFERHLSENNVLVLKFFLHISHDEQRKQLLERLTDPTKNWKFNAGDLDERGLWNDYTRAYHDALRKCSTPWAPWYVVPSDSNTTRNYLVTRVINHALSALELRYPRAPQEVLALKSELGG